MVILILGSFPNFFSKYTHVAEQVLATPNFWFYALRACAIAIIPVVTYRTLIADLFPTRLNTILRDKLDEIEQKESLREGLLLEEAVMHFPIPKVLLGSSLVDGYLDYQNVQWKFMHSFVMVYIGDCVGDGAHW